MERTVSFCPGRGASLKPLPPFEEDDDAELEVIDDTIYPATQVDNTGPGGDDTVQDAESPEPREPTHRTTPDWLVSSDDEEDLDMTYEEYQQYLQSCGLSGPIDAEKVLTELVQQGVEKDYYWDFRTKKWQKQPPTSTNPCDSDPLRDVDVNVVRRSVTTCHP